MNAKSAANKKATKALQSSSNKGMLYTVLGLVAVAVLVLGGVILVAKQGSEANPITFGETADPQIEITTDGVMAVGEANAPLVQMWEDFMCPACGNFEGQNGERIASAVKDGKIRVEYHTMNFLDRSSGSGQYSTRALAAMQCVAAYDSLPTFFDVKNAFFAQQPAEGGGDRSAKELADAAKAAGADTKAVDCIGNVESNGGMDKAKDTADNSQRSIREVTDRASTPTVAYDGKVVDISNPAWLDDIIAKA